MSHPDDEVHFRKWFADRGDATHRLNYPLNTNSVVFDIGGFKGEWAKKVLDKWNCNLFCFEPVMSLFEAAEANLKGYKTARLYRFGIGGKTTKLDITVSGDASSIYETEGPKESIEVKCIKDVVVDHNIKNVDLCKINIEGGEYELMEYILDNNLANIFDNFQIQFHRFPFLDKPVERRQQIHAKLIQTHHVTWNYPFVWENWKRN